MEETEAKRREREERRAWLEADRRRAYDRVLEGRTLYLIGDSYLAGNGLDPDCVWPALLGEKYGMAVVNRGVNGSTLSAYVTTNHPVVQRLDDLPDNRPDLVIVEGGRNDYNQGVPLGSDDPADRDIRTMKGALRDVLDRLRQKYPGVPLLCLTVWEVGGSPNAAGHLCSDYGRAMLEVCGQLGVRCVNAMESDRTGVRMTDPAFRAAYCMKPGDVSHLNAAGMRLVLPVFERAAAEALAGAAGDSGGLPGKEARK